MVTKYAKTIAMDKEAISGEELRKLQKDSRISVLAICRMTGLSRTSVYRAFDDESCEPYKVLIYIALKHPEVFCKAS